jgi:hypothetical protein
MMRVNRANLAARLQVELNLCRGMRLMVLIVCMLVAMFGVWSSLANPEERLHLRRFLVDKFRLGALDEMRTLDQLHSYLGEIDQCCVRGMLHTWCSSSKQRTLR